MPEFRAAPPRIIEAMQWQISVEDMAPHYRQALAVLDEPMPADPVAKGKVATAKLAAGQLLPAWQHAMFPED